MICLPVSSVGLTKISNMSNTAGRLSNTSFIDLSQETDFVCFYLSVTGWSGMYNGKKKDICWLTH